MNANLRKIPEIRNRVLTSSIRADSRLFAVRILRRLRPFLRLPPCPNSIWARDWGRTPASHGGGVYGKSISPWKARADHAQWSCARNVVGTARRAVLGSAAHTDAGGAMGIAREDAGPFVPRSRDQGRLAASLPTTSARHALIQQPLPRIFLQGPAAWRHSGRQTLIWP